MGKRPRILMNFNIFDLRYSTIKLYFAGIRSYVEYQYNLGSGPAVIRVTAQRVDDGERHRIILNRQGSEGSIELNGEHTESGMSDGFQQTLNARGNVYLGGVPDYAMTYRRYHHGFSGCIYSFEVQDSGAIDIGSKAIRGTNVSPCTRCVLYWFTLLCTCQRVKELTFPSRLDHFVGIALHISHFLYLFTN